MNKSKWFRCETGPELEVKFRCSHCCGARVTASHRGNRYLTGICRHCEKLCVEYDIYKSRFRYVNVEKKHTMSEKIVAPPPF